MAETAPPKPARRWRDWLLIASLGLNLVVLGLIAGAILRGPPDRQVAGPAIGQYARALPDPYRRDIGRELRASWRDWSPGRDTLRSQRESLAAALTATPYDPARVASLLQEELSLATELGDRGVALLLSQIERMGPEDRAAFAEAILQPRSGGRRGSDRNR